MIKVTCSNTTLESWSIVQPFLAWLLDRGWLCHWECNADRSCELVLKKAGSDRCTFRFEERALLPLQLDKFYGGARVTVIHRNGGFRSYLVPSHPPVAP